MRHSRSRRNDGRVCKEDCSACCYDLLLLVVRPPARISQAVVRAWSPLERIEAIVWAAAEHLRASDNNPKRRLMPMHVVKASAMSAAWHQRAQAQPEKT